MQRNAGLECGLRWTLGSESPPSFPRWIQLQAISSRADSVFATADRSRGDARDVWRGRRRTQVDGGRRGGGGGGPQASGRGKPLEGLPRRVAGLGARPLPRPPPTPVQGAGAPPPGLQLGHAQPRVGPGSAGPPRPPQVHGGALNTPSGRPRPPASPRALGSRGTGPQGARRRPRFSRDGDTGRGGRDVPLAHSSCPAGSGLGRRPVPCPASGGPRPRHMAAPFKGVGNESLARRARVHGYTPVLTEKGGG